jgi:hypothetical protein
MQQLEGRSPQHTGTCTVCVSQRVQVTSSCTPGAGLQHPNATRHAVWEATSQVPRGRGRRCTDANPQQALQPSFTPRRSGGRDERSHYTTVELCACARAMDSSRRAYRDVTANPKRVPFVTEFRSRAQFTPVSVQSVTPASGRSPDRLSTAGHSPAVERQGAVRRSPSTSRSRRSTGRRSGLAPVPRKTQWAGIEL